MSLQSELTRLQANASSILSSKDAIMAALTSKGVTVPSGATLHDVPNLIGQINGSAPPVSTDPTITFRFANSAFDPTSAEQVAIFGDADHWERVTGSSYNDWKYTTDDVSIYNVFLKRFSTIPPGYTPMILSGVTEVLSSSNLDKLVDIESAFNGCDELVWTPDFDVTNIINCSSTFSGCTHVTAYQLYLKLSAIPNIVYNSYTFMNVADANKIPSAWGGTA